VWPELKENETRTWKNNLKEMVQSKIEKCNSKYLLKLLTKHLATVGNIYPNLFKLLCVFETLIISTSAVERVFSKVQLNVTVHRNRLKVSTTSDILMISINNENVDCLDLDKVVDEFLSRKKRRICQ
jgi:hypothetical protein